MSRDVSTLAIEVKATGIQEVSTALGGLSRSAGTADTRITSLTEKLAALMRASGGVVGSVAGLTGSMAMIQSAMVQAAQHATALSNSLAQSAQGMVTLTNTSNQASGALQRVGGHSHVVTNTLKALATVALTYFSVSSVKNIVEQADAWAMMQSRLKLATGSMEEARRVQQQLFDMSQNMRAPLDDMGRLYTRLAPALGRMGKSAEETRNMVEGVTLALKLGGATTAEAASTMLQFSQAANAGRLNGQEFNAIAENGVVILRALEDHLGKNQAELKKMGAEGKLTFDLISEAMDKALPKWRKDFQELPLTFEGAMQRLKNAWFKAIGEMGQETELGKKLGETLLKLEQDVPRIAETVIGAINFVIDNAKILTTVFGGLLALGVAKWALEGAAAFMTMSTAITAAGGAAAVMRGAMAFLGGPIGIITGLVGLAATAWLMWSDDGKKASVSLTTQTKTDVASRVAELQKEIDKLRERNKEAGVTKDTGPGGMKLTDDLQDKMNTMIELRKKLNDPAVSEATKTALKAQLDITQQQFNLDYTKLALNQQAYDQERKANDERERQKKLIDLNTAATKQFGTAQQRAAEEIKDWKEKYAAIGAELPKDIEAKILEKYTKEGAKATRELKQEMKDANAELERQKKLYGETALALERMKASGQSDEKLTTIDRERLELTTKLAEAKVKGHKDVAKVLEEALAKNAEAKLLENEKTALQEGLKAKEDYIKSQEAAIASAEKEALTLQDKVANYGLSAAAIEANVLAMAKIELASMTWGEADEATIARQRRLVEALQAVQDAKARLGQLELGDKVDKALASLKVADYGNGFADAFGEVGKAIDKAGKSLDQYSKKMVKLADIRKDALNITDEKKRERALETLRKEEERATMDMYADMAGSVKNFFSEKTVAYKAFDALEKGLRIARMADDVREFIVKQMNEKTWLGTKIAGIMTAMGWDATETAASVANSGTKAAASTTAGVAKVFEQMGIWGFVGAAAVLAFMASLGVGGGGGSSGPSVTAEDRQKQQGAGTVLGDSEAKSDSIVNSLEEMRKNSNIGLEYTSTMLMHLRNIDLSIGGLAAGIARLGPTAESFGVVPGSTTSSGISGFFGKTETTDVNDLGIKLDGRIADLINGEGIKEWIELLITKTRSGFLGIGGSTTTYTPYEERDAGEELALMVGGVLGGIVNTVSLTVRQLGGDAAEARRIMRDFELEDMLVSLEGLTGDDLQDALQNVFSSLSDEFAELTLPGFEEFQRLGEGYFETLTRIATGTERARNALDGLGVSMIGLADVRNKTGDIDVELVRDSLVEAEAGTSLARIMDLLDGSMEDLIEGYRILTNLRSDMSIAGLGRRLTLDLIRGAGGLEELADHMETFFEEFYTDAERSAMGMGRLQMEFGRLGIALPQSKSAFRALVTELMNGDAVSQELAGRVLALSGVFNDVFGEAEERQMDRIADAKDVLAEAYDREAEALENVRDKMQGFADSLKAFRNELLMDGELSPLNTMQQYRKAQRDFDRIAERARNGDEEAIGQFQGAAQRLLELSRQVNASGGDYTREFERVLRLTEVIQRVAEDGATEAEQQLEVLREQVGKLIDIDESVISVRQAIRQLARVTRGLNLDEDGEVVTTPPVVTPTTPTTDPTSTAALNQATIAAAQAKADAKATREEIQRLRQEVVALRSEQRTQTNAIVRSNFDGADEAADKIVAAVKPAPFIDMP